ncbi:nucleotidyltransferase domain-containing protein [Candidatus Calescamantes bacterium]|nr:nucleotidyltransferase domain-containing protein [Candidatus Calescamantes bacterium]
MRKLAEKRILKTISRELSRLKEVVGVILFGSYARGDYGARSDIDLFILVDNSANKEKIEDTIIKLENKISRSIQPTIRTKKELKQTDTGLLQNIFQEGKVLYLREPLEIESALLLKQRPYVLFTFELKNLSQKEKAKFDRKLYPHAIHGYKYPGLLQKIGGEKLSSGCVLVPFKEREKMEKIFRNFKVKFNEIKIWK